MNSASNPSRPPASVGRRWAARLALLVAIVGSVATAPPESDPAIAELTGAPLRLTAAEPRLTRDLVIRLSARENVTNVINILLRARVTARWTPPDSTSAASPMLRGTLSFGENNFSSMGPQSLTFGAPGRPVSRDLEDSFSENLDDGERVIRARLDLELQSTDDPGIVDVDWKADVEARVQNTSDTPKGFSISLTEP